MGNKRIRALLVIGFLLLTTLSFNVDTEVGQRLYINHNLQATPSPAVPDRPSYGPVIFSSDFDDTAQQPLNTGNSFASGITKLYAYWVYSGVQEGGPYTFEWLLDGKRLSNGEGKFDASAGYLWQWTYITDGSPLKAGIYQIVVRAGGQIVLFAPCVIGGASEPAFSPVTFASAFDEKAQRPANGARAFTFGIKRLYACWGYSGLQAGGSFEYEWFLNGQHLSGSQVKFQSSSGFAWQWAEQEDGSSLKPGTYKLVVKVGGKEVLSEQAVVEAQTKTAFGPAVFSSDFDETAEKPVNVARVFTPGLTRLYAFWEFTGVKGEDSFTFDWFRNGEFFAAGESQFKASSGHAWLWANLENDSPLTPGIYQLVVRSRDQILLVDQCLIIEETAPTPAGTSAAIKTPVDVSGQPSFGPVVFSSEFDREKVEPINPGESFPADTTSLYAYWPYKGVDPNSSFKFEWLLEGKHFAGGENGFEVESGHAWQRAFLNDGTPLVPGQYQIKITVGGKVVLTGQCNVTEGSAPSPTKEKEPATSGQPTFGPVTFSSGFDTKASEPVDVGKSFAQGITSLYAYWPYDSVNAGDTFTFEWTYDGKSLASGSGTFNPPPSRAWQWVYMNDNSPLKPGTYGITVKVGEQVVLSDECVIE